MTLPKVAAALTVKTLLLCLFALPAGARDCPSCGKANKDVNSYCTGCGATIPATPAQEEETARKLADLERALEEERRARLAAESRPPQVVERVVERAVPAAAPDSTSSAGSTFRVVNVKASDPDGLNLRETPGAGKGNRIVYHIPFDATGLEFLGEFRKIGKNLWMHVRFDGIDGWVNSIYLAKD